MKNISVVAIGCRLMMDDCIGITVAEAIEEQLANENMKVVIAETDFEFGMDKVMPNDFVIVLDAMVSGKQPGKISVFPLNKETTREYRNTSQHEMNLIDMICNEGIYDGCLIGIEAAVIDLGDKLSKSLQENFHEICVKVVREIKQIKEDLIDA